VFVIVFLFSYRHKSFCAKGFADVFSFMGHNEKALRGILEGQGPPGWLLVLVLPIP